jgi:dTDP-4-amino-4,6-dideoxy-D-galactose acyltransferase
VTVAQTARCTLASWDTAFFGRRIGRFEMDRPSAGDVTQAVAWAREHDLDCLYALVDADAIGSARALEAQEFRFADIRLTLDRGVGAAAGDATDAGIDDGRAGDLEALVALARSSHPHTRFTADPGFGLERAADLYATWVATALDEPDAIVLVPRADGRATGYLTLHALNASVARIGVLAVAPDLQRRGVGRALVAEGLRRAAIRGVSRVSVVTQGGNAASVRFYERCGFEARRAQLWYHRWFTR